MIDLSFCSLRVTQCLSSIAILAAFVAPPAAQAQTDADRALIAKARSHYLLGPVPGNIACDVQLDWDRFLAAMKIDQQSDAAKSRIATLKKLQITVVSRDPTHTDVNITGGDSVTTQVTQGLQQQLQGFFQIYWSMAYGNGFPTDKDEYHLTSDGQGYTFETRAGPTSSSVHMDSSFSIDHIIAESPQMKADMTSAFKPGDDSLLRLRSMHEDINLGSSKMELDLELDYQGIGKYEVPQHVDISIPGAFAFNYLLTNCKVDPLAPPNTSAPVAPAK